LTGFPTSPTQSTADTSTDIATDAFVHNVAGTYAPLASPALTGFPTSPTQSTADTSTDIATDAFVHNVVAGVSSANPTSKRQAVSQGPGAGAPTFLPATSASLSLASQNISSSAPLVVTSANGWASAGQIDNLGVTTTNLTWSSLTASQTNYLGVTISGGALTAFSTTLQPIYQYGGTISVVNGQYTFDIAQMKMFVGNGTTATQVNAVLVGEAVAGASTITSTLPYAYNGQYISALTAIPAAGAAATINHNLGVGPIGYQSTWTFVCVTTNLSYAVGEEIPLDVTWISTAASGPPIFPDNSTRNIALATVFASETGIAIPTKGTGAMAAITQADWNLRAYVNRSF
jgi:hypothetical protein